MSRHFLLPLALTLLLAACVPLIGTLQIGVETPQPTPPPAAWTPTDAPPAAGTPTDAPPSPTATETLPQPPANGSVSGRVCYPSEFIPAMTAYFLAARTGDLVEIPIAQNQAFYRLDLPPGEYYAFAWVAEFQLGGAYTAYVACGFAESCTDHALQLFSVQAGQETANIDLCDWPVPAEQLPLPFPVPPSASLPEEAILITEPGPGSRLTSPLRVRGIADPTFEQTLVIRLVLADGTELALTPVIIQAELGQRGPFEAEIPFTVTGEQQAFIQVYTTSARDGGVTHLSALGVTLAEAGPTDIRPVTDFSERIVIYTPALGSAISGGVAHVEGFALASFEQHLLAEVVDENGKVIGFAPLTVNAPDLGIPGPFVVDIPYTLAAPGPGRIVIRDPSPAFDGDVHLSSVEVNLAP